jgi:hypothetical protein
MKCLSFAFLLVVSVWLLGCTAPSMQQVDAMDRQDEYRRAYADYMATEKEYLNILFNLETHPQDEYLLEQKTLKRKELEHLRTVMMQARGEFDDAIVKWDDYVRELRSVQKDAPVFPANQPTSPGHLVEPPNRGF